MNRFILLLFPPVLLLSHAALSAPTCPYLATDSVADSVGIERKDGRKFVLHRVDQGQTLYAVARRYHATLDAIKAANPDLTDNVRYDQLLRVPVGETTASRRDQKELDKALRKEEKEKAKLTKEAEKAAADEAKAATKTEPKPTVKTEKTTPSRTAPVPANGLHVVETGQTLYSLAVRYSLTMADIRRWNDLGADGIKVGQTLIVSEKAFTEKSGETSEVANKPKPAPTARPADPTPAKLEAKPIVTPAPLPTPGTRPTPTPKKAEPKPAEAKPVERPAEKVVEKAEPKATEPRSDNEPVAATRKPRAQSESSVQSEIGFADLIEGNDVSSKYLALHRSAPVGTLVQVRNDITNQSLYVKVIGKLPDTGINNQVLVRLSGRAFEKLSPNGQRFRAEVSYAK